MKNFSKKLSKITINKKQLFIALILIALVLGLLYSLVLPKIIHIDSYRGLITKEIQDRINYQIEIGKVDLKLPITGNIIIIIDHIKLNNTKNKPVAYAENVQVRFAILPLIFNDILIKDFKAKRAKIYLQREADSNLSISDFKVTPKPEDKLVLRFINSKARINNYNIDFIDKAVTPQQTYNLAGSIIRVFSFTENKYIKLKAMGAIDNSIKYDLIASTSLPFPEDIFSNKILLNGSIENFNLERIIPYTDIKKASGIISFKTNTKIKGNHINVSLDSKIQQPVIIPKYALNLNTGSVNLDGKLSSSKINIRKLTIKKNDILATIDGNIKDWKTQNPFSDLKIATNTFNIKTLIDLLPVLPENKELLDQLIQMNINGNTKLNIHLINKKNSLKIYGPVDLRDYSFLVNKDHKISNIKAHIDFQGSQIKIKNGLLPLSSSDLVQLNGIFNFKDMAFNDLTISTNYLKINAIKILTNLIPELSSNDLNLINNTDIQGYISSQLTLNNKLEKPDIKGKVTIKAEKIKLSGLNTPLKNIQGELNFEKSNIKINDLSIHLGPKSIINVQGSYDFQNNIINKITLKSGNLNLERIKTIARALMSNLKMNTTLINQLTTRGSVALDTYFKGSLKRIQPYGQIILANINIIDNPSGFRINNLNGTLSLNNNVKFKNITFNVENNDLILSGSSNLAQKANVNIDIPGFNIQDLINLGQKLKILNKNDLDIINSFNIDGVIGGNILITQEGKKISPEANLKLKLNNISNPILPEKISVSQGNLQIINNSLSLQDLIILVGKSSLNVSGKVNNINTKTPDFSAEVFSNNITYDLIHKISKLENIPANIQQAMSKITGFSGGKHVKLYLSNKSYKLILNLNKFNLNIEGLENPIKDISGSITASNNDLLINRLIAYYNSSNLSIHGGIHNFQNQPTVSLNILGNISPLDFKEFLEKDLQKKLIFSKPVKFISNVSGNLKAWNLQFESNIDETTQIAIKDIFKKPENTKFSLLMDFKGTQKDIEVKNISLQANSLKFLAKGILNYSPTELLTIQNLNIKIPNFDIGLINEFLDTQTITEKVTGMLNSDLTFSGSIFTPNINGFFNIENLSLPMLNIKDLSSKILLDGREVDVTHLNLDLNGSIFEISTHIHNLQKFPIELSNLKIYSPSLQASKLLSNASIQTQKTDKLPITIKSGQIKIDDAIIGDLITSNLIGQLSLCPSGLFQINNLHFETAGGKASGNIYYNLLEDTMGVQLKTWEIKANAAATILLDLPNEIFGNFNGALIFNSKGKDYDELIQNARGEGSLAITDGRFTRLGTLEHLLTATNIISGGITGLTLNNILSSIIPMHTGDFELFSGDLDVKEGIMYTKDLATRGKNLSLNMNGSFNILTEDADLLISGYLSKKASGLLGPIGNININTFLDHIPIIGYFPGSTKNRGLIDLIPFIRHIPGFGRSKDKKIRKFSVEIKGKLYDMSSVKNFQWIK